MTKIHSQHVSALWFCQWPLRCAALAEVRRVLSRTRALFFLQVLALRKIFAVTGHCGDSEKCLTSIVRSLLQHTLICCQISKRQLIKESRPAAFLPDMPIRWSRLAAALLPPSFQTSLTTVSSSIVSGSMLTSYPHYSQGSSVRPEMGIWVCALGSSKLRKLFFRKMVKYQQTLISAMPNRILFY